MCIRDSIVVALVLLFLPPCLCLVASVPQDEDSRQQRDSQYKAAHDARDAKHSELLYRRHVRYTERYEPEGGSRRGEEHRNPNGDDRGERGLIGIVSLPALLIVAREDVDRVSDVNPCLLYTSPSPRD